MRRTPGGRPQYTLTTDQILHVIVQTPDGGRARVEGRLVGVPHTTGTEHAFVIEVHGRVVAIDPVAMATVTELPVATAT